MRRNELSPIDIAAIIQTALRPIDDKVNDLLANRVTRADMDKLRGEIMTGYVSRDVYEARHSQLGDRIIQLETLIREERKEREDEILKLQNLVAQRDQAQLSGKDQWWMRASQIGSGVAVVIAMIGFLMQHIKFF